MATVVISPATEKFFRPGLAAAQPWDAPTRHYDTVKLLLDMTFALVMLVLSLPFILVAAILIKLTSRGPVFYSQLRVGRYGRVFRIWKLRTMTHNCECHTGAQWSTPNDSRITRIGAFLRKTHLDELPQLWNVLRGDMSLVGPRPERPEFVPGLEQQIAGYADRLAVRPGITGLAQVQLRADTDIESVRRKLRYDLWYIANRGFWLDLRLILSTGLKVLHIPFSFSRALFRIPSKSIIEPVTKPSVIMPAPETLRPIPSRQPEAALATAKA